jgi:hypothetical protein
MKVWLQKYRISNALNERRPRPLVKAAEGGLAVEARCFAAQCQALEQGLKRQPPPVASPAGLHDAIMRAVQAPSREASASRMPWFPRWQLAGISVLVAGLGFVLMRPFSTPSPAPVTAEATPSLALAGSVLDLGDSLVCAAPSVVLAPLATESASLDRDLARAGNFIIASLP